jgi:hypothetical protein
MIKKSKKELLCQFQNMCCEKCKTEYPLSELEIHRINRGGSYDDHRNLMVLCKKHHRQLHQNEYAWCKSK